MSTLRKVIIDDIHRCCVNDYTSISDNGSILIKKSRDVSVIYDVQRQKSLSDDSLKEFIGNLNTNKKTKNTDISNFNSDDLLTYCKSRYIQTPNELKRYANQLTDLINSKNKNALRKAKYHGVHTPDED